MNNEDSVHRDVLLENFAAELTRAAYFVALRARTEGSWLDLELGLWKALTDKIRTWGEENSFGTDKLDLSRE